jgi:hypothetical protein
MTIKAVPVETRKQMVALAAKAGLTMGEWLARVVPVLEQIAAGDAA